MPLIRVTISIFLYCLTSLPLAAQSSVDISQYDKKIAAFSNQGPQDSFLYYKTAKADLAKQQDALLSWATEHLDIYDFLYENTGPTAAAQYLNEAWAARWREPKNAKEWNIFCFIQSYRGMDFLEAGKIVQAIETFEAAADIYQRYPPPDLDLVESIYKPLGNGYTMLGDNDKALAVLFKILPLNTDNDALAGAYCNIGIAYWNKEDYVNAEAHHRKGLALTGVSRIKKALLLGALSQTLLDKGQAVEAADYAKQSLAQLALEPTSDRVLEYRCYSRRSAGIANLQLGYLAQAKTLLTGARSDALMVFGAHSRDLGKIDIAFAKLLLLQGNAPAAMAAANQALSGVMPWFKSLRPMENPDPASFYEENIIFEALGVKAEAASIAYEKNNDLSWLKLSLQCHQLAWEAERKLRKIYQYSSSKLNLQSASRSRQAAAMRVARLLFEKTGEQRYLEQAFQMAERSKASLLSDALQDNLLRQGLVVADQRFSKLSALRQNFSLFEKQLLRSPGSNSANTWRIEADSLATRIKALELEINAAYPQLSEWQMASFADVSASLSEGACLLEYFVGPAFIEVFVFQKNQTAQWYSIANDADLQALVMEYLRYFENQSAMLNDPAAYLNHAYLLWQKLLPASANTASKITIVPDGFLNFIPFDALLCSKPAANSTLRNADYALRRHSICYAWSFSVLEQQKKLKSKAKYYALSLSPGFAKGERGQAPLLSTPTERPANSKVLENNKADLQHFMSAVDRYRLLHLSTHAYASTQAGQLPRLELFDQALYLPSIYALPLQADLVVLSACQTGLGQVASGEGVMSLARAFAQAGAACVVSSLWSVNDKSTSALLSAFYRNLEAGHPIAEALREAKLKYLEDESTGATMQSPYFWAGLVMVGDNRVVETGDLPGRVWLLILALLIALSLLLRKRLSLQPAFFKR